jgi:uncharacterized protein
MSKLRESTLESIAATIKLTKQVVDIENHYQLDDEKVDWLKELVCELEEEVAEQYHQDELKKGSLKLNFSLLRRSNSTYKEHLVIQGDLNGTYQTPCVKCLELSNQIFSGSYSACFLHDSFESNPEYEEVDSIFCEGEEREVYFFSKGLIDLKEFIHEQIYMNIGPFPLHDPNCKGLCGVCGVNLNRELCPHQTAQ